MRVEESHNFIPDVDVRKKKGPDDYGIADLTKYYDKFLQPREYEDSTAPLEVQFYFYARYFSDEVFGVDKAIIHNDFRQGLFYLYNVDWGDGSAKDFLTEPEKLGENKAVYHTYESSGTFKITGTMIRVKPNKDYEPNGVIHHKKFTLYININEGLDEDFIYFGTDGSSFIPYKNTVPIIGGYSEQSIYYQTIKRQLGIISDDIIVETEFDDIGDRLKTEVALDKMDNSYSNNFNILNEYKKLRYSSSEIEDESTLIYSGMNTFSKELGESIGNVDLTEIRYFNEPKQMWQMLGFEDEEVAIPENLRYWKNIIPKDYSIYNREGIVQDSDGNYSITKTIENPLLGQIWLPEDGLSYIPYYPVLPKYNSSGEFIEGSSMGTEFDIRIPFPMTAIITNENPIDDSLKISINTNLKDSNVYSDNSGKGNLGFPYSDFKPRFTEQTLKPKKIKNQGNVRKSNSNGAF